MPITLICPRSLYAVEVLITLEWWTIAWILLMNTSDLYRWLQLKKPCKMRRNVRYLMSRKASEQARFSPTPSPMSSASSSTNSKSAALQVIVISLRRITTTSASSTQNQKMTKRRRRPPQNDLLQFPSPNKYLSPIWNPAPNWVTSLG